MPVVEISVWATMTKENEKKIVEGITQVLKDLGIPERRSLLLSMTRRKSTGRPVGNCILRNTAIFPVQIEQPVQECASIVDLS